MINNIAKLFMRVLASSVTAFLAGVLSVITLIMGGFVVIPALQTWLIMKYQQGNYFVSGVITFVPWIIIYLYTNDQPNLTQEVINLACRSAIVGILIYGVRYHVYPKIMAYWSSR
ncbi:hypothetical protein VIOR3934_13617 [Vibrio orientalis CIP 102891 = ATCC 33934]|uniref:Uncharacterized protein n=1 Tax=Vibrio orientalis CIP 102891 = ATCC 33934 TaxID=675816 RepID=F9SXZ0_VIBOR|nr:hypothetical protein [Vibrio orientalis]EGU46211.1 hypothetical protein VIOR3934_13617 [Vibrio orientalis CIP 102891 = ATCC 33934]